MEERFYLCNTCGNMMFAAIASGIIPYCCGKEMSLLKPNTTDGDGEKHLPVVTFISAHRMNIKIGSQPHPMTDKHNIRFICLETDRGCLIRYLDTDDPPEVDICFTGKPFAVYAYCNIHGLWRTDISKLNASCPLKRA